MRQNIEVNEFFKNYFQFITILYFYALDVNVLDYIYKYAYHYHIFETFTVDMF